MSLFQARRKPKRVTREESDQAQAEDDDSGPVVRRPGAVKQKSKLRVIYDPSTEDNDSSALPSESEPSSVVRPIKRSVPSSLQDRLKQTSLREDEPAARPSYSKSALDELRASTPSTPKDLSLTTTPDPEESLALSVESKFGKLPSTTNTSIPSSTEIAERKARRARLALEQSALPASTTDPNSEDYIPLDAYDSDGEFKPTRMQVGTWHQPSTNDTDTRLVHEDEDIAEGFDEFTEPTTYAQTHSRSRDGKSTSSAKVRNRLTTDSLNLTSRSARANAEAERSAIRAAIDAAENLSSDNDGSNDNDDDDDAVGGSDSDISVTSSGDRARQHAYELSQTSHALPSSLSGTYLKAHRRPKQPREMTPIVKLSVGLSGLRERVEALGTEKARLRRRLQEVGVEREEVKARQEFIQKSLVEGAKQLEGVLAEEHGQGREEADLEGEEEASARMNGQESKSNSSGTGGGGSGMGLGYTSSSRAGFGVPAQAERGLENFGSAGS